VRPIYLALNVTAAVVVAWWASTWGESSAVRRLLLAGAALANLGFSQTIINGNYAILVVAALVSAWTLREKHPLGAGLLLGMSLVKPTVSLPFVALFLADRRYRALTACAVYLAASFALTVALTGDGPVTLLRETLEGSSRFATGGYGLWQWVRAGGASQSMALTLNALVFLVPFLGMTWWYLPDRPQQADAWLPLLALAAVVARVFTYHNSIDNVLLAFPVVALSYRAARGEDVAAGVLAAALIVSVLIPFVMTRSAAAHVVLYSLWLGAAVYAVMVRPVDQLAGARRAA
jgi:hypothetical protein